MGTFTFTKSSNNASGTYIQGKIEYSVAQNVSANTTTLTMTLYVKKDSTTQTLTIGTKGTWSYSMSVLETDGSTVIGKTSSTASAEILGWQAIVSKSYTIAHNSNGEKSIKISGSVTAPSGTGISGKTSSGTSSTIALKTIPRTTSLSSAGDVTLGNKCNIKWTPVSSSFAYKLKFACGNVSYTTGYISPGTTSSYTYTGYTMTVATWADAMPTSYSATCTVTLYTYANSSASSAIGSDSTTFKLTLPSKTKPTVSFPTPVMVNGWNGYYIQGKSKCTLSAAFDAGEGSTIKSCSISGVGISKTGTGASLSGTTSALNTSGTITYTATVTDGRATVSTTQSIYVYPYAKPTITLSTQRTTNGPIKVTYKATCSPVNSKNSLVALNIYQKLSSDSIWSSTPIKTIALSSTSESGSVDLVGLDLSSSYDFKAVVTDTYGSSSETVDGISTVFKLFNMHKNQDGTNGGVALGKMSEDYIFDCNLPARFRDTIEFGSATAGSLHTDVNASGVNIVYLQTGQDVEGGATMGLAVHRAAVYVENEANNGKVNLGSGGRKWNQLYAVNGTIETSDKTVKKDISEMSDVQEQLFNKLRPVQFKFTNGSSGRTHYGFISQDVENSLNELNLTGKDFAGFCKDLRVNDDGNLVLDENGEKIYDYSLRYSEFIALNTYMIQKLQEENEELRWELKELKEMIANLNSSD